MKYLIILLLFLTSVYCFECNTTNSPKQQCNCQYGDFEMCCSGDITICVDKYSYMNLCYNNVCTGDLSFCVYNYSCPTYKTTAFCTPLGINGICNPSPICITGHASEHEFNCPDTSIIICACNERNFCEQFGCFIRNITSPSFNTTGGSGGIYSENCSDITTLNTVRCPGQFMNPNRALFNLNGVIICVKKMLWQITCLNGATKFVMQSQINPNCSNSSLITQGLCADNFSFVHDIASESCLCIENDNLFNICELGQLNFLISCIIFPSTTGIIPAPSPFFIPISPIPPFAPFPPFPLPPIIPLPPISPIPIPPPPTPSFPAPLIPIVQPSPVSLNGVNCSELVLNWPQGDCIDGFNESCCTFDLECCVDNSSVITICITIGTLLLSCQEQICTPGKCIIKTPSTTPVINGGLSGLAIAGIIIGIIISILVIIGCIFLFITPTNQFESFP